MFNVIQSVHVQHGRDVSWDIPGIPGEEDPPTRHYAILESASSARDVLVLGQWSRRSILGPGYWCS